MKTWLEIYYPECADETKKIDAIRHSLRKWIGLKKENLRRFNVSLSEVDYSAHVFKPKDADPESRMILLEIDSESCALCFWYYKERFSIINGEHPCSACPLFDPINEKSCSDLHSPYYVFAETRDPSDMIKALRKILLEQLREEREKK